MHEIKNDDFYDFVKQYASDPEYYFVGEVDYHILEDDKPYEGLQSHREALSVVFDRVSQNLDVFLYHFIWKKTGNSGAMLWLRNNGSTLTSQAVDTVLFTTIAFWNVYPANVFFSILITTYLFKAVVALLDTPFMYLARRMVPLTEKEDRHEDEGKFNKAWERAY